MTPYDVDLDRNPANFQPLTPLSADQVYRTDSFGVCRYLDQRGCQALTCRILRAHEWSSFQGWRPPFAHACGR